MELIIYASVFVIIAIAAIVISNKIIAKKNQVAQAFGSIEIYLKKRFDLIPNLVAMLNKYLSHEKEILIKSTNPKEKIEASNELTKVMSGLNINVEHYPNLKADVQFTKLQIIANIRKDKTQPLLEIPKAEQKEININQLFTN